jgi:hypothetical protein
MSESLLIHVWFPCGNDTGLLLPALLRSPHIAVGDMILTFEIARSRHEWWVNFRAEQLIFPTLMRLQQLIVWNNQTASDARHVGRMPYSVLCWGCDLLLSTTDVTNTNMEEVNGNLASQTQILVITASNKRQPAALDGPDCCQISSKSWLRLLFPIPLLHNCQTRKGNGFQTIEHSIQVSCQDTNISCLCNLWGWNIMHGKSEPFLVHWKLTVWA